MIDLVLRTTRVGVLVLWIAFALSFTGIIPPPFAMVIAWIGAFVLLIHLLEFLLIKVGVIELASAEVSFMKTMLFGMTYWVPMLSGSVRSADEVQSQPIGHDVHDVVDNDHKPA